MSETINQCTHEDTPLSSCFAGKRGFVYQCKCGCYVFFDFKTETAKEVSYKFYKSFIKHKGKWGEYYGR